MKKLPFLLLLMSCKKGPIPDTGTEPPPDPGPLDLWVFDSGQGDCAVIGCPDGTFHMVDCGSGSGGSDSYVQQSVAAVLNGAPLSSVIITHPDSDHFDLIPLVTEGIEVGTVWLGGTVDGKEYDNEGISTWLASQDDVRRFDEPQHDPPGEPSEPFTCGDIDVYVAAANVPSEISNWQSNSNSVVLKLDIPGVPYRSVMLTGDATFDTELAMLDVYDSDFLNVDLLKLGHHGSDNTSSDPGFLAAVAPDMAVVSAGEHAGFLHPRCAVVERVLESSEMRSDAACHQVQCGEPLDADVCDGDGDFCTFETTGALWSTRTSGNLHIRVVEGSYSVLQELGSCAQ